MGNEGGGVNIDFGKLYMDIENELAANSLKSQDPIIQKTIKMCVFHIILKAIALSKDPKADKRAILALYESAREIIVNSTLDEDETTHNRLQDLINSMIDGEDISAQLRSYTAISRKWLDSKVVYLESKLANIAIKNTAIETSLKELNARLATASSIRRTPSLIMVVGTGLFAMLFTIITSVAIITFFLTSSINNEALTSQQAEKYIYEHKK